MSLTNTLWWLDLLILSAGALILLVTIWRLLISASSGFSRTRERANPLRGSPTRPNRISPISVWICVTAYFVGGSLGNFIGKRLAPTGISEDALNRYQNIIGANFAAILSVVACLGVARFAFARGWRGLGIGRRPLRKDLIAAIGGWLAATSLCTGIAYLTEKLMRLAMPDFQPPEHSVFTILRDPSMPRVMHVLAFSGALLLAPVAEELLFRGILQTGLRKLLPATRSLLHRWGAIVLVSILFGAMHSPTPQHVAALAVFGMILGFLYERTGSLTLPILVHLLFNAKSLIWAAPLHGS